MIEPSLQKFTAFSFALHLAFFSVLLLAARKSSTFIMPSPYMVNLVSPQKPVGRASKAQRVPPAKTLAPKAVPAEVAPAEVAPEKPEKEVIAIKKEPSKPTKRQKRAKIAKLEALKVKREVLKAQQEALKAKQEKERMLKALAQKQSALSAAQKRAQVRKLAASKASVEVSAKGADGLSSLIEANYYDTLTSQIHEEWRFLNTGVGDIYTVIAIKVLKDGTLVIVDIERSSGNAIMDREALNAIKKASPVDPPPYEMDVGVKFYPE